MILEATGFRDSAVTTPSVLPTIFGISTLLAISLPPDFYLRITSYCYHRHVYIPPPPLSLRTIHSDLPQRNH